MPTYQYKIKETITKEDNTTELVDKIIDVLHSYKCLNSEEELPEIVKKRITYTDENGKEVLGERLISSPYLGGFNEFGTSKSTKFNADNR